LEIDGDPERVGNKSEIFFGHNTSFSQLFSYIIKRKATILGLVMKIGVGMKMSEEHVRFLIDHIQLKTNQTQYGFSLITWRGKTKRTAPTDRVFKTTGPGSSRSVTLDAIKAIGSESTGCIVVEGKACKPMRSTTSRNNGNIIGGYHIVT
jgi:hypothetical protein